MGDGVNADSAYDKNGNIRKVKHTGWKTNSSQTIDQLQYSYAQYSNKLMKVLDSVNDPTSKLGDFKGGTNVGDDYSFDGNGNMTKDENKGIATILYSHLNLPYEIRIPGKGKILYAYDNAGTKWRKTVYDSTGSTPKTTIWTYMQNFVWKNDTLEMFSHEEGRVRVDVNQPTGEPVNNNFDYFLKDHLGNVRMVLTEEKDTASYPMATLENATIAQDTLYYSVNTGQLRDVYPQTGDSTSVLAKRFLRVNGNVAGEKTGLGIVLKVMAGDKVSFRADSYYNLPSGNAGPNYSVPLTELLAAFTGSGAVAPHGVSSTDITGITGNTSALNDFLNTSTGTSVANAHLNWVLFDDQFKYVSGDVDAVGASGAIKNHMKFINSPAAATKNGYLYIFVSNKSDLDVFFDNLAVTHYKGPILEETHYYPFGLTMAGISSKAMLKMENRYKYNGIEQNTDLDLNTYEAHYRNLDPQIGRWWSLDPRPNVSISGYASMDNNPVRYADPLGDTAIVKWRSGFLGLGGRHEARYVGGQWIDAKSRNGISASNKGAQRLMNDYNTLNGDKNFSPVTKAINSATNAVNLNSGGGPGTGGSETNTPKYFADLANGVANPDIDVYARKSESLPGQVFEKGKSSQASYITLGHELGHVWDILNSGGNRANFTQIPGLAPGISNSEMNAMYWENVLRKDANMNLRLWYHYDQNASPQFQLKANVNYVPVPFLGIITIMSDLNKTNSQIRF